MDVGEWERQFCYQKPELSSECLQHTHDSAKTEQIIAAWCPAKKKKSNSSAVISAMVPFRAENRYSLATGLQPLWFNITTESYGTE